MPYRFIGNRTKTGVAFVAEGKTLDELLTSAGVAVAAAMVKDVSKIEQLASKQFSVDAENVEMLLFIFLQELIFYKDAELLLLSRFDLDVSQKGEKWHLRVRASGEEIDQGIHDLVVDVKAVSLHHYSVEETQEGWRAEVMLEV
jgi:SHS2 domain-containing protein